MCCAPAFAAERQISDCVPGVVRELADGRSEGVTLTRQIAQPAAAAPAAHPPHPLAEARVNQAHRQSSLVVEELRQRCASRVWQPQMRLLQMGLLQMRLSSL